MDKQQLHDKLTKVQDSLVIPVDEFISVYGDDKSKNFKGKELTRADILANTYNLDVIKEGDNYVFTKRSP